MERNCHPGCTRDRLNHETAHVDLWALGYGALMVRMVNCHLLSCPRNTEPQTTRNISAISTYEVS